MCDHLIIVCLAAGTRLRSSQDCHAGHQLPPPALCGFWWRFVDEHDGVSSTHGLGGQHLLRPLSRSWLELGCALSFEFCIFPHTFHMVWAPKIAQLSCLKVDLGKQHYTATNKKPFSLFLSKRTFIKCHSLPLEMQLHTTSTTSSF